MSCRNDYIENLETKRLVLMLLPQNPDKAMGINPELNDDIDEINVFHEKHRRILRTYKTYAEMRLS